MSKSTPLNARPRRAFLSTVDCPHCARAYFIEGTAPIDEGHQPHYFACECERKVMAVVPRGAEILTVNLVRSPQPATKTG